jgi:hypothetical protein
MLLSGSGASRSLLLRPQRDRFGTATVTVTVSDGGLTDDVAIAVTVNAVNDAPRINALRLRGKAGVALAGQCTGFDPEGAPLSFAKASNPDQGAVSVAANGAFTWTPPLSPFHGLTSFTATASDGGLMSDPARIWLDIRNPLLSVPWIVSEPEEEIAPGDTWTWVLTIDRRDISAFGNVTVILVEKPAGMTVNGNASSAVLTAPGNTATLSWTADGTDRHVPVLVQVSGEPFLNQGYDLSAFFIRVRGLAVVE